MKALDLLLVVGVVVAIYYIFKGKDTGESGFVTRKRIKRSTVGGTHCTKECVEWGSHPDGWCCVCKKMVMTCTTTVPA
jgi:hypothetical protein